MFNQIPPTQTNSSPSIPNDLDSHRRNPNTPKDVLVEGVVNRICRDHEASQDPAADLSRKAVYPTESSTSETAGKIERVRRTSGQTRESETKLSSLRKRPSETEINDLIEHFSNLEENEISSKIHELGLNDQDVLIKIALGLATKQKSNISKVIHCFAIKDDEAILKIITEATRSGSFSVTDIDNYGIISEEAKINLFKALAAIRTSDLPKHFRSLGIRDPSVRLEIATIAAKHHPTLPQFIRNFEITEEEERFELAKLVIQNNSTIPNYIPNFEIDNDQNRFELAEIAAKSNRHFPICIQFFKIERPSDRTKLALIAAANNIYLAKYLKEFNIEAESDRIMIAKVAAAKEQSNFSEFVNNFNITDQRVIFELAVIAAETPGSNLPKFIGNFRIEDQQALAALAKIAVKTSPVILSEFIENFGISDTSILLELLEIAIRLNGLKVLTYFENFGINSKEMEYAICQNLLINSDQFYEDWEEIKWYASHSAKDYDEALADSTKDFSDWKPIIEYIEQHQESLQQEALKNWIEPYLYLHDFYFQIGLTKPLGFLLTALAKYQDHFSRKLFTQYILQGIEKEFNHRPDNLITSISAPKKESDEEVLRCKDYLLSILNKPDEKHKPNRINDSLIINRALLKSTLPKTQSANFEKLAKLLAKVGKKDILWFKNINQALYKIGSSKEIQEKDLTVIFDMVNTIDSQVNLRQKKKKLSHLFSSLNTIISLHQAHRLNEIQSLEEIDNCLNDCFCKAFNIPLSQQVNDQYEKIFFKYRDPNAIFTYLDSINQLKGQDREEALEAYSYFINGVMNQTFLSNRYNLEENPHLNCIFGGTDARTELFEKWKKGAQEIVKKDQISNADNNIDYFHYFKMKIESDLHLGRDWQNQFPILYSVLNKEKLDQIDEIQTEFADSELEPDLLELIKMNQDTTLENKVKLLKKLRLSSRGTELKNDIDAQLIALQPKREESMLTIVDTDDPQDLLMCGTEIHGSCQRINGDPETNVALLGFLLNGQTRLIAVKRPDGALIGRCILRLLIDSNTKEPVLFRERYYINNNDVYVESLVKKMCEKRAEALNLPLYDFYSLQKSIESLGGRFSEYVDSAQGIKIGSIYTIE